MIYAHNAWARSKLRRLHHIIAHRQKYWRPRVGPISKPSPSNRLLSLHDVQELRGDATLRQGAIHSWRFLAGRINRALTYADSAEIWILCGEWDVWRCPWPVPFPLRKLRHAIIRGRIYSMAISKNYYLPADGYPGRLNSLDFIYRLMGISR